MRKESSPSTGGPCPQTGLGPGLLVRMAVGVRRMPMAVLAVMVGRRRVFPRLFVLTVGVMVGRLQMMMRGGVMMRGGLMVMLDGRVFLRFWHGLVLLTGGFANMGAEGNARLRSGRSRVER
jgi:hypothetical protein